MKWTPAQQETIEARGKNILVSAAAGSGKTTVLIERIKQLVLQDRIDIDRFLITTFTKAAATEMKEKMERAIRGEIERVSAAGKGADGLNGSRQTASAGADGLNAAGRTDPPEPGRTAADELQFLRRQLTLLSQASIGTFHSFAMGIMKDFFYLTDLEPGFSMGDEIRMDLMRKESVDEVFDRRFEEDTDRFKAFLRKYSGDRNDERLKENILDIYKEMQSIPHYMNWAESRVGCLAAASPTEALQLRRFLIQKIRVRLAASGKYFARAALLLDREETGTLHLKALKDAAQIEELLAKASRAADDEDLFEELWEGVAAFKAQSMRATKAEKPFYEEVKEDVAALRDKAKNELKAIKEKFFGGSMEEHDEILRALHGDTEYYLDLIRETEAIYKSKKQAERVIDFDDVMHYAIEILEDEAAAQEYRDRFEYIFIDEYQDSNLLQEYIVGRIARKDNLFMVGDVKQSIYKFRLAEPEIFRDKYQLYRDGGDPYSRKIDLNSNFRSKKTIRDTVNRIFEEVMEGYDEDARLNGDEHPEHPGEPVTLHIIDRSAVQEADPAGAAFAQADDADAEEEDQELENLTEAALTAQIIRERVGQTIYDRNGDPRPLKYGDIAVLSRGRSGIAEIERYLNNEGIPAYGEAAGEYYETVEIQVFLNLLKVISNLRQDVPLISVMHSMFFGFSPAELAEIRIASRKGSYHQAVMSYAENGENAELRGKIAEMLRQIGLWKEIGRTVPLEELIQMLMYETGYYDYCSSLPVGHQRVSNLRLLLDKAAAYDEMSHAGLHGFLSYVDAMKKSGQKVSEASVAGEGENVVKVMTVHKSKGLEFPLVILTGAGKKIASKGAGRQPVMHKSFSIGLPQVDRAQHWERRTILQNAIAEKKKDEDLEEEIRILYVALTRPMDELVIVGSIKDREKLKDEVGTGNFIEMIYPAIAQLAADDPRTAGVTFYDGQRLIEEAAGAHQAAAGDRQGADGAGRDGVAADEAGAGDRQGAAAARPQFRRTPQEQEELRAEIGRRLSYVYPYEDQQHVKTKYSVTELNRMASGLMESQPVRIPALRDLDAEETQLSAAQAGTAMHTIMERIDFRRALEEGLPYIESAAAQMRDKGVLTEAEYSSADLGNIAAFFMEPAGRAAALSEHLYREKEFLMQKVVDGVPAVVQGVIDCWYEDDDGLVLIDYKNSRLGPETDEETIIERYRDQIRLYREALEAAQEKPVKQSWLYLFQKQAFAAVD